MEFRYDLHLHLHFLGGGDIVKCVFVTLISVRFGVLTGILSCDACGLIVKRQRFGEIYCLHLQDLSPADGGRTIYESFVSALECKWPHDPQHLRHFHFLSPFCATILPSAAQCIKPVRPSSSHSLMNFIFTIFRCVFNEM
jgi:hypothetical protein